MLLVTYLCRELRHRLRQTIFIVAGLAVGIGLVLTVAATSSGVSAAQGKVLASLYGLGTDITVGKAPSSSSQQNPGKASAVNPGQAVDMLISGNHGTFNSSAAAQAAKLNGVTGASAELILQDFKAPATLVNAPVHFTPPTLINVDGVEPGHANVGTLGQARLASGRWLRAGDANANVAVIDAGYAKQNKLKLGSTITIAKTPFTVVGIVLQPSDAQQQVFIPITRAQSLAGLNDQANTMHVQAGSSADVDRVAKELASTLPWASIKDSSSLADEVTGSLTNTSKLANDLGRWVAIAALGAAFALAVLLTLAAVARRVREFGTLKAIGWRTRRIVGQVLSESTVVGLLGGALGVGLGYVGAGLVSVIAPSLSASLPSSANGAGVGGGLPAVAVGSSVSGAPLGPSTPQSAAASVTVHFGAHIALDIVLLALLLGLLGGMLAGAFGGWRAARLSPAAAFRQVA